jgi:hypothetical protein
MVNYNNGKIYKIEPICEHDECDIYIGSTTKQYLSQRMDKHRSSYKSYKNGKYHNITSFIIFDKYGVENCDIILLESVNVNSKDELHIREAHYIKTLKCVNKVIPLRTGVEYYKDNETKIKQYYNDNKILILQKNKKYKNDNKDKIKEWKSTVCVCECGLNYTKNNLNQHLQTKKHKQLMDAKPKA